MRAAGRSWASHSRASSSAKSQVQIRFLSSWLPAFLRHTEIRRFLVRESMAAVMSLSQELQIKMSCIFCPIAFKQQGLSYLTPLGLWENCWHWCFCRSAEPCEKLQNKTADDSTTVASRKRKALSDPLRSGNKNSGTPPSLWSIASRYNADCTVSSRMLQ